jgi:hypothetical protein
LDHVCHSFITPEDVLWAIENFYNLTQNEISQIEDDDRWEKLRVFRPKFEADGFLTLIPLTRRPLTFETLLKLLYRRNWKRFLNPECNTESEDLYSYYDFIADPNFVGRTEILLHKLQELALLGKKGVEIAKELSKIFHSPDVERLKKLTREMILLDNSIYHIEMTHPETAPITVYFRIQKNNAESDNLDYIANMAQNLYGRLQKQSEIMIEELMAFQKLSPMMKEAVAL